jgi:hypothetical protein
MERRRKAGPRVTTSRLDPSDYDASPFAISIYPNIDEFTEHGQIVIGYIEPVGAVAIASEGRQTIAMLRRRKDEPFKQLLARLDTAIAKATIDDVYVDEVNTPQH